MPTFLQGDATDPRIDGNRIIAHVCNDIGAWGRGFVMALSQRWPAAEHSYRQWHAARDSANWPPMALGQVVFVPVDDRTCVANMVAQRGIGRSHLGTPPIRYDALEDCLTQVASWARDWDHASVHMPRIGCGLAGGRWEMVGPIVERTLVGLDSYVYDI